MEQSQQVNQTQQNLEKAKILAMEYIPKKDVFVWKLLFVDKKIEQNQIWRASDLFKIFNLSEKAANKLKKKEKIKLLNDFCQKMTNKEVKVQVVYGSADINSGDAKDTKKLEELDSQICDAPFQETYELIAEEDNKRIKKEQKKKR